MKRFYSALAIIFFLSACLNESSVAPAPAETFVRYYNGGGNDKAVDFEKTSDEGFIILATTEIAASDPSRSPTYRVKLIKTDDQGAVQWQGYFPPVPAPDDNTFHGSARASSIDIQSDGSYVVSGDLLKYNSSGVISGSKAMIAIFSTSGDVADTVSFAFTERGHAVTTNSNGNYLLLSSKAAASKDSMKLSEIRKGDFVHLKSATWGVEQPPATNHIYLAPSGNAIWANTDTQSSGTIRAIRVSSAPQSNPNPLFSNFNNIPGYEETAVDISRFGQTYATVGSTNRKDEGNGNFSLGDRDILFVRYDEFGNVQSRKSYPLIDPLENKNIQGMNDGQDDIGNGICSTLDGGLILLGTVDSKGVSGRGDTEFMLIKLDPFGEEDWRTHIGSRFKDTGVAVRQTAKGNYVVLGNTNQGGLDMIMLARTDKNGKIQ